MAEFVYDLPARFVITNTNEATDAAAREVYNTGLATAEGEEAVVTGTIGLNTGREGHIIVPIFGNKGTTVDLAPTETITVEAQTDEAALFYLQMAGAGTSLTVEVAEEDEGTSDEG